jgi:hypothetical protein
VGDEGIVLTDREREALAGLAESIGDPWLARQLSGQDVPPPPKKKRLAGLGSALYRATAGWIGLLLLLAGGAVVIMTFVHSTVVASLGLLVMGFGAWRLAVDRVDSFILRWTARRTPSSTAPPAPPRTPPAAA